MKDDNFYMRYRVWYDADSSARWLEGKAAIEAKDFSEAYKKATILVEKIRKDPNVLSVAFLSMTRGREE